MTAAAGGGASGGVGAPWRPQLWSSKLHDIIPDVMSVQPASHAVSSWCPTAHLCCLRLPPACARSTAHLPACLQQVLKAVAFFAGAVIVSRNFGDAFAI